MKSDMRDPECLDWRDLLAVLAAMLLACVVFANGLRGDFILDDQKQIVRNDLIRLPQFWAKALTSDVWAFQGERDVPWSNYWRPGHVAWLILNYRLFGADPIPWHATNILAHLVVIAAAYVVIRWLGATVGVATVIVCIFAIHPTRVESVTWLAGVHDVLAAMWQLLALICVMSIWRTRPPGEPPLDWFGQAWRWSAAVVFYVLAVSTKEIAIFFPVIVAVVRWLTPHNSPAARRGRWASVVAFAVPFALVAGVFLVARHFVIGGAQLRFDWQPGWRTVGASLPVVLAFYLRQLIFPYWLGWSYPVRVVHDVGLASFLLPLAIVLAAGYALFHLARTRVQITGLVILVLTLLPALNLKAFIPEQIVKDRYLYMPLLGFLMVVVPAAAGGFRRLPGVAATAAPAVLVAAMVAVLGLRTIQYNRAWLSELSLWESAVRSDPTSATNHAGLGVALMINKRYPEARAALDRSLDLHVTSDALTTRAEVAIHQGEFQQAVDDCLRLLEQQPENFRAYERLAVARQRQGMLDDAARVLREARERVPYRRAIFTDQLAVVLYQQGDKDGALRELESVRQYAESDFSPASRLVLFRLGQLYYELGRHDDARAMFGRFLELTGDSADPLVISRRAQAEVFLGRIR